MIKFTGDINFSDGYFDQGYGIGTAIKSGLNPFQHINREKDDIWVGNCECVVSNKSNKRGVASNQFRVTPSDIRDIPHMDIYAIANNHVMQHGVDAYEEMFHFFSSNGILTIGSKRHKWQIIEEQHKKVGLICFSQRNEKFSSVPQYWYNPSYSEILDDLESLKGLCDYVVAYIHWGNEFISYPYRDQMSFAHFLIDSGVDLIIGMHPHVIQGVEDYKGKKIFYSLGNFLFNMPTEKTKLSIVVSLDLSANEPKISYQYYHINTYFQPVIIDYPNDNTLSIGYLSELLNKNRDLEHEEYYKNLFKEMKDYRRKNHIEIIKNIHKTNINATLYSLTDYFKRHF